MNRSWFRNPFSSAGASSAGSTSREELEEGNETGEVLVKSGRRRRRRGGAQHSDTSANASNVSMSDANSNASMHTHESVPPLPRHYAQHSTHQTNATHAHAASLHSISSIRTAHFADPTGEQRTTNAGTGGGNGTSTEVSPSKTPDKYRDRMSWASTASGMIGFDDGDYLEAERRWEEAAEAVEEQGQQQAERATNDSTLTKSASKIHLVDIDEDGLQHESQFGNQDDDDGDDDLLDESSLEYYRHQHVRDSQVVSLKMTASRSSTSLKSILKKSTASGETAASSSVAVAQPSTPGQEAAKDLASMTPARTVTFSPSTLPPAASPPETSVTPEHPRGRLTPVETPTTSLAGEASPPLHTYVTDPALCSPDESAEVEEALLSRSDTPSPPLRIQPHVQQAPEQSANPADLTQEHEASASVHMDESSNDSLRLLGSASKRGAGFLDRMLAFIPSPDVSIASPARPTRQPAGSRMAEVSNLLDMSVPAQINDMTLHEDRSRLRSSSNQINHTGKNATAGPKPLLLRQSTIFEEPSSILFMRPYTQSPLPPSNLQAASTQPASTSPIASPTLSPTNLPECPTSPVQDFHSFNASQIVSPTPNPATAIRTPLRGSMHSRVSLVRKNSLADSAASNRSVTLNGTSKRGSLLLATKGSTRVAVLKRIASVDEIGRLGDSVASNVSAAEGESVFMTPEKSMAEMTDERHAHEGFVSDVSPPRLASHSLDSEQEREHESTSSLMIAQNALVPLPTVTPSSSSSSLLPTNQESPFSRLVANLLGTQDELLSQRADQKTLLLSLIANLRGELASRDRALDTLEKQKCKAEREVGELRVAREQDRQSHKTAVEEALIQVDQNRSKLLAEVSRRESALREQLAAERQKIPPGNATVMSSENEASSYSERIKALERDNQNLQQRLQDTDDNLERAKAEVSEQAEQLKTLAKDKAFLQTESEQFSAQCQDLAGQLASAEMQITRLTSAHEQAESALKIQIRDGGAKAAELQRRLNDSMHALGQERLEQARQYDQTASVHEELRQHNDTLLRSVAELEHDKEDAARELRSLKQDASVRIQESEEHIAHLEMEILRRSTERRKLVDGGCIGCKEFEDRTAFLESEIVRLREVVGKMRLESADREVRLARLAKARDQLRDDVDGLNIALEAKQQEVSLLKRASRRESHPGEAAPSTSRPASRVVQSRPSSVHDTVARPVSTLRGTRVDARRISHAGSASILETPSLGGALLSHEAAASSNAQGTQQQHPTARSSHQYRPASTLAQQKLLEAASLVREVGEENKENSPRRNSNRGSISISRKQQQLGDLPNAPKHLLAARERVSKRRLSLVAMHA